MAISALDKDTAKLITTTQIITSVSTAAKELIENALDANAKSVEINLVDNGCTLIEVKDDGCGISKEDASYMALSSYTSKIITFSDLYSLETYGFRGEALHALSTISDLTIITKTAQDEAAVSYDIDHHGCIKKSEHCHRVTGTTVQVKQLFKQVPVRRQIITNAKKANRDVKFLESLMKSYGICKFNVRINYRVDNNVIFAKPSTSSLEEAANYTLGKRVMSNMYWINIECVEINGKLLVPSKGSQNMSEIFQSGSQYIFVNDRPIKHKELEKIITRTILRGLGQDSSNRKKPIFILYILTNASNIDVNLEPNKTCIFFKEENVVLDRIQTYLDHFYEIERETREENECNQTTNDYQDEVEDEIERPACKKRKLQRNEDVISIETDKQTAEKSGGNIEDLKSTVVEHSTVNEQALIPENQQNYQGKDRDKCEENIEHFNVQLPILSLSDSDSNDSQKFKLLLSNHGSPDTAAETKKQNAEDSPPFELSSETLSQLPVVDLGDDFAWDNDDLNVTTSDKEDNADKENKLATKECVTLKKWSKGHVADLKGSTDIQPYNYIHVELDESSKADGHRTNVCAGFLKFSNHVKPQVMKQNPNIKAPQIANMITNLWKKLSSEERGYYRDVANEEKVKPETDKRETKAKQVMDNEKHRNRLLKAFEKMKTMNSENSKNLVMRTVVPWDIDLSKITLKFDKHFSSMSKDKKIVVGSLTSNLWVVHKFSHIWVLDATVLKRELHTSNTSANEDTAEIIEQLLKLWFSTRDDLSLLHPIHSLPQNADTS